MNRLPGFVTQFYTLSHFSTPFCHRLNRLLQRFEPVTRGSRILYEWS